MKRISLFIIVVTLSMALVGCVDTDITLDIDKKGNMIIYSSILVKDSVFKNLTQEELNEVESKYGKVEKITSPGKSGYRTTTKVGNLNEIKGNDISKSKELEEFKGLIKVKEEKELLYNTYDIKFNIKDYLLENRDKLSSISENKTMIAAIARSSNLNFKLNLPIKLIESNATTSNESGGKYTYSWNYTLNSMDNIYVKAKIYNTNNIIFLLLAATIILGVIIFIILRILKNNKMN